MPLLKELSIEEMVDDMARILRTSARMYMCLTNATLDAFGRDGEMAVRRGVRGYGVWRGSEMREAHHALGLAIDMKNLIERWDNASVYLHKDQIDSAGEKKPDDNRFDVVSCPASEAWKEAGFHRWGHVYCDDFHQFCAQSYHPDGNVVIPMNLMKGDDRCRFRWVMPGGAQPLDLGEPSELGKRLARNYQADTEEEAARNALRRSNRLVGGRYITAARVLVEEFADKGVDVIRAGMRAWGELRGQILRREHAERGLPIDLVSLMRRHDLPYRMTWTAEEREADPGRFTAEIGWTPQDEVWRDLDGVDLGVHWYEPAYEGLIATYLPGARLSWTRLMCRGDAVNELEIRA